MLGYLVKCMLLVDCLAYYGIGIWTFLGFQMGVSLNGGTPKTAQNDHF